MAEKDAMCAGRIHDNSSGVVMVPPYSGKALRENPSSVGLRWDKPKKERKLNVLIRDKISFVGVAHWTHGSRSCSWVLYRSP